MTAVYPFTFAQLANLVPDPSDNLAKWSGHDLVIHANSFDDSARRARRVSDWWSHDHCIIRSSQLDAELRRRGLDRTSALPTCGPQLSELMDPDAPLYLITEPTTTFHHETGNIHGARFAARHYSKSTANDVYLHERTAETTILITAYRNGIERHPSLLGLVRTNIKQRRAKDAAAYDCDCHLQAGYDTGHAKQYLDERDRLRRIYYDACEAESVTEHALFALVNEDRIEYGRIQRIVFDFS